MAAAVEVIVAEGMEAEVVGTVEANTVVVDMVVSVVLDSLRLYN